MRFVYFFISHSIFIACCAVGLCAETFLLLHIPIQYKALAFVFFSTICSYNFYWLLSKFYFNKNFTAILKNNVSNFIMLFLGGVGALYYFKLANFNFYCILISFLLTILYSIPLWPFTFSKQMQKLGFAKTVLLAFTWAFVTVVLPLPSIFIYWKLILLPFIIRFLFMLLLCIIFDKRDIVVDKINGLQTLVTKMDKNVIGFLYFFLLFLYLFFSVYFFSITAPNFYLLLPCFQFFILAYAYKKSLKPQGYFFYYFFIDGLMLVSTFINFIWVYLINNRNPF